MRSRVWVGRRFGRTTIGVSAPVTTPGMPSSHAGQRAVSTFMLVGLALGCLALAVLLF